MARTLSARLVESRGLAVALVLAVIIYVAAASERRSADQKHTQQICLAIKDLLEGAQERDMRLSKTGQLNQAQRDFYDTRLARLGTCNLKENR